ncbi:membrane dipeptidase [Candidatus Poribacteria bacterium]|nr:membrane dipeptidase [Candidatus Poribacteria bacterium]
MTLNTQVSDLHEQALVIDSHNDAIVAHIRRGNVSLADENTQNPTDPIGTIAYLRGPVPPEEEAIGIQLNIPKMRQGGIDAAFFAVDVTRAWKNHLAYALDAFGWFETEVTANTNDICIARNASDIREAKASGKLAAVLVIENSEAVERSLNILRSLYMLGVRSIGLTHNLNTWASTGNDEEDLGGGLTRFGMALVKEMNRLGMLVDVSHISERGFWDVLEISEHPVIASHSNCKTLCRHPRNLSNEQLKALAANGGVVGITFVPGFITTDGWAKMPPLAQLLNHFAYAIDIAGIDHVGIGSDFDGGGDLLKDAGEFIKIAEGLSERGYTDEDIRKVLGGNHLRVFEAACG